MKNDETKNEQALTELWNYENYEFLSSATSRDPDLPFPTISRQYRRGSIRIPLRQGDFAARNREGLA